MVKAIPDGYSTITPYLIVHDAAAAIEFYKEAFGAKEIFRLPMGPRIGHAEMVIGNSRFMLADEFPERNAFSAKHFQGSPINLLLYVDDVDGVAKRAAAAGATVMRPVENQFYGDRTGVFLDPFGFQWSIATHVEDVSPEEMQRRMAEMTSTS